SEAGSFGSALYESVKIQLHRRGGCFETRPWALLSMRYAIDNVQNYVIPRKPRSGRLEGAFIHLNPFPPAASAAVIMGRNEWQPDDSRRPRGAAHQELQGLALHSMLGSDVAHCDRPADRGAEAAAGYFPQCAPCVVHNLRVL